MTTYVKSGCHCGVNAFKIPFKTSSLPKEGGLCHCNICRHSTGQMSYMSVTIDGAPLALESTEENPIPANLDNLTIYKSSSYASRYFCTTCSCHMFFYMSLEGESTHWSVTVGTLEKCDGVVTMKDHIFLDDTLDGGIANHYRSIGDRELTRHKTWDSDPKFKDVHLPLDWKDEKAKNTSAPERLPYYCSCKSVQFYLTRATKLSDDPSVYWLVPGENPTDPIRFVTAHCLCNSCRLTGGGLIQSWSMVPKENVFDSATKAPIDFNNLPKGLKVYDATPGKHRGFCGTCGATAIWWKDLKEGESAPVDISVGLVDQTAVGGARAESWLAWYGDLIFKEFALSKETAEALQDGLTKSLA